jgi:hypothetical protein
MAAGDVGPGAGTQIYIGGTGSLPISPDLWVKIGRVETAGAFGRTFTTFTFADLDTREEELFKGTEQAVIWELGLGHQPSDTGQAALDTALDSDIDHNFKVVLNDSSGGVGASGTIYTFKGKVLGNQKGPFNNNSVVKATVRIGITAKSLDRTAAT